MAVAGGTIVGFSLVLPTADDASELEGLVVEPERMRGGVGRGLLADAADVVRARGARRMEVTANPRAPGFYEAIGFVEVRTTMTRFGPRIRMHWIL